METCSARDEFQFEIENTHVVPGRAYVFARSLSSNSQFRVVEGSPLGGYELEPFVDIPRKLDAHGNLRADLFAFVLRRAEEVREFVTGDLVVLCAERVTSDRP